MPASSPQGSRVNESRIRPDKLDRNALVRRLLVVASSIALLACSGAPSHEREPTVPAAYGFVVPLLTDPEGPIVSNLMYEGNNALLRSGLSGDAQGIDDGAAIASRWRATAERTRGLFALRDSLWNQQDHPTRHRPVAITLPPSWITLAAMEKDPRPVRAFAIADDVAWTSIPTMDALFGSYTPSPTLFQLATQRTTSTPLEPFRAQILNARSTLIQLNRHTVRLQEAARNGWRATIAEGAAIIAEGDRAYFGVATRRDHVVPILVENPRDLEIEERKGYLLPGLTLDPELVRVLVTEICQTRLRDGDIALERYDLRDPAMVERALTLLEWIIPNDASGETRVWLWVTGRLDPGKGLRGEGALAYVDSFLARARSQDIDLDRLRLLNKPSEPITLEAFSERAARYRARGLFLSVSGGTSEVLDAVGASRR